MLGAVPILVPILAPRKQEFEETCREEVRKLKEEMDYEQVTGRHGFHCDL